MLLWLIVGLKPAVAEIGFEGYEERQIEVYFEYAGNGRDWLVQPPPLALKEEEAALGLIGTSTTGREFRTWVRSGQFFAGYEVTLEEKDEQRFAVFAPFDRYASPYRIALGKALLLNVRTAYFGMIERGDTVVAANEGDEIAIEGKTYGVGTISPTLAMVREAASGKQLKLPLSLTGELRSLQLREQRRVDLMERERWALGEQREADWMLIGMSLSILFGFMTAYAAIVVGLLTRQPYEWPRWWRRWVEDRC